MGKNVIDILGDIIIIAIGFLCVIYHKSMGTKTAYQQQQGFGKWFHLNLITDKSIKSYQRWWLAGGIGLIIIGFPPLIRRLLSLF